MQRIVQNRFRKDVAKQLCDAVKMFTVDHLNDFMRTTPVTVPIALEDGDGLVEVVFNQRIRPRVVDDRPKQAQGGVQSLVQKLQAGNFTRDLTSIGGALGTYRYNHSLVQDPVVADGKYLEMMQCGELRQAPTPQEPQDHFPIAERLPESKLADKHISIDIGDYVVNSLLYHAWKDGFLRTTMTSKNPVM